MRAGRAIRSRRGSMSLAMALMRQGPSLGFGAVDSAAPLLAGERRARVEEADSDALEAHRRVDALQHVRDRPFVLLPRRPAVVRAHTSSRRRSWWPRASARRRSGSSTTWSVA